MALHKYQILFVLSLILIATGCKQRKKNSTSESLQTQKELVVYCENSMLGLILNLKEQFEIQYNCKVRVQNDCAQNLMDLISYTGKGDLYIPSSTATFEKFYQETGQALMDSVFIGYNSLTFMVKKGNPTNFDGRFSSLLKDKYSLIIANPETSSIGFETRKLLQTQNVYDRLLPKIVALTSDSKGLIKELKNDKVDIVIDWESNYFVNGNRNYVDIIKPDLQNNLHIPIFATSLSCSSEPVLTKAFLNFTNTQLNENRLSKYGFTKRKTIIF
nr:substrate-binding domain-containing protein [uncultured Carboxylicivirga sp.]